MPFAYRYLTPGQVPLRACPGCQSDLTDEESVEVEFVRGNGSTRWTEKTHLDEEGNLIDLGAIAQGFHSETRCALCEERLIDFDEDVTEVRFGGAAQMKLRFTLLDAKGFKVRHFDCEPRMAIDPIWEFLKTHGEDPNAEGSIAFGPVPPPCPHEVNLATVTGLDVKGSALSIGFKCKLCGAAGTLDLHRDHRDDIGWEETP